MPLSLRPLFALFAAIVVSCPSVAAFQSPLSDQAVREAYFLGQRRDESMAAFLTKYTRFLPPPKSGPNINSVTFLTPFALLVEYSSRQFEYSAQQAALDHKSQEEAVEISVEIVFTASYGAFISKPTNSRSGSPIGTQLRSSGFWHAFKVHIFDGEEEITTDDLTGEPRYVCTEGGCTLSGATLRVRFPAAAFYSDSASVQVVPPEGEPVSVDFELASLR